MQRPKPSIACLSKRRKTRQVVARSTGKVVALEGAAAPKHVAIAEWDSLEKAEAFYKSRAWVALAPQRDKAVKTIRRYAVEAMN